MTQYRIAKHFTIPVEINGVINLKAMLDTGATANFIHRDLVKKHGIQTIPRQNPLTTKDVHGRILAIVDEQAIFRLWIRSHIKMIIMDIMPTGQHSLILGMPWMETHDPWIRIADKDLMFTSRYCQENCLNIDPHVRIHQNPEPNEDAELFGIDGTTFEDPREHVPIELHEYLDGFNDRKAKKMPKDRGDWNFKIDFIEGWEKQLPKPAKRYRLTKAEQQAELETLQELQEARMIRPSRSLVAAPTFFVPKKDRSKRYIVDWRGINAITVKDAYPLPLLDDLLDMAQGATIMSKFDLMASYNQIPITEEDRWKTAFITSQGLFEFNVMHFGFCNAPPHMQ